MDNALMNPMTLAELRLWRTIRSLWTNLGRNSRRKVIRAKYDETEN